MKNSETIKKPTKNQKAAVNHMIAFWKREMNLHAWKIDVNFSDKPIDDDESGVTNATTNALEEYMAAHLTIYPSFFEKDVDSQHDIIVHELTHMLLWNWVDEYDRLRSDMTVSRNEHTKNLERSTQSITRIITKLRSRS